MFGNEGMVAIYDNSAVTDTELCKRVVVNSFVLNLTKRVLNMVGGIAAPVLPLLLAIVDARVVEDARNRRLSSERFGHSASERRQRYNPQRPDEDVAAVGKFGIAVTVVTGSRKVKCSAKKRAKDPQGTMVAKLLSIRVEIVVQPINTHGHTKPSPSCVAEILCSETRVALIHYATEYVDEKPIRRATIFCFTAADLLVIKSDSSGDPTELRNIDIRTRRGPRGDPYFFALCRPPVWEDFVVIRFVDFDFFDPEFWTNCPLARYRGRELG